MLERFGPHSPQVDPTSFVHPRATVIGEVRIDARASIWPGAVLRGDMGGIHIGAETSVQDGTVCHMTGGWSTLTVGNRVTVGHNVVLHGCTVEDMCLIGMGAVILDNAVIGKGSLVAAGAVVTAGTVIPPGSFVVGAPARVVKPVSDKQRGMLETGWRAYVDVLDTYKATHGDTHIVPTA